MSRSSDIYKTRVCQRGLRGGGEELRLYTLVWDGVAK